MNDVSAPIKPGSPAAGPPGVPFPFPVPSQETPRKGCLKWGLVGCAGASVLVICGLVFLMTKATYLMDVTFARMSDEVFAACTQDVTPEDRNAFRMAMKEFAEKAKARRVTTDQIWTLTSRERAIVSDRRVTPDELRDLTSWLKAQSP